MEETQAGRGHRTTDELTYLFSTATVNGVKRRLKEG
jgi:hypothetical protein